MPSGSTEQHGRKANGGIGSRIQSLREGVSYSLKQAGSAISTGLRSCDDASGIITAGNELIVGGSKALDAWGADLAASSSRASIPTPSHSLTRQINKLPLCESSFEPVIWGNHSFELSIDWTANASSSPSTYASGAAQKTNFAGEGLTGCIKVTAWLRTSTNEKKTNLAIKVKWTRKCAGFTLKPLEYEGTTFPITADDVGCVLLATVTSLVGDYGTAHCEVGPFELDAGLRTSVQSFLQVGSVSFSVDPTIDAEITNDNHDKSMILSIDSEVVNLTSPGLNNVGYIRNRCFPLSSTHEIVKVDLYSSKSIILLSGKDDQDERVETFRICALSKRQRDIIALTIRAFQTMKFVNFSLLLEQLGINTHKRRFKATHDSTFMENDEALAGWRESATELDFYMIFDQLNRQLMQATNTCDKAIIERNRAVAERDALEEDIGSTIQLYRDLLQATKELQEDGSDTLTGGLSREISTVLDQESRAITQRAATLAALQTQLKETQAQAKQYLDDLERARREQKTLKQKLATKDEQLRAWMGEGETRTLESTQKDTKTIKKINELEEQLRQFERMNMTLTKELSTVKDQSQPQLLTDHDKKLAESRHETTILKDQLEDKRNELYSLHQDNRYLKSRLNEEERRAKTINSDKLSMSDDFERLQKAGRRDAETLSLRIRDMETELLNVKRKNEDLLLEGNRLKSQNQSLEKTLTKAKAKLNEADLNFMELNKTLFSSKTLSGSLLDQSSAIMSHYDISAVQVRIADLVKMIEERDKTIVHLKQQNMELDNKCRKLTEAS